MHPCLRASVNPDQRRARFARRRGATRQAGTGWDGTRQDGLETTSHIPRHAPDTPRKTALGSRSGSSHLQSAWLPEPWRFLWGQAAFDSPPRPRLNNEVLHGCARTGSAHRQQAGTGLEVARHREGRRRDSPGGVPANFRHETQQVTGPERGNRKGVTRKAAEKQPNKMNLAGPWARESAVFCGFRMVTPFPLPLSGPVNRSAVPKTSPDDFEGPTFRARLSHDVLHVSASLPLKGLREAFRLTLGLDKEPGCKRR